MCLLVCNQVDLKCAWLEQLDVGSDGAVLTRRGRLRDAHGAATFGLAMPDAVRVLPRLCTIQCCVAMHLPPLSWAGKACDLFVCGST